MAVAFPRFNTLSNRSCLRDERRTLRTFAWTEDTLEATGLPLATSSTTAACGGCMKTRTIGLFFSRMKRLSAATTYSATWLKHSWWRAAEPLRVTRKARNVCNILNKVVESVPSFYPLSRSNLRVRRRFYLGPMELVAITAVNRLKGEVDMPHSTAADREFDHAKTVRGTSGQEREGNR